MHRVPRRHSRACRGVCMQRREGGACVQFVENSTNIAISKQQRLAVADSVCVCAGQRIEERDGIANAVCNAVAVFIIARVVLRECVRVSVRNRDGLGKRIAVGQ